MAMTVGVARVSLYLEETFSLKDKRQVVRSITQKVRNQFNAAIAEVADLDDVRVATLAFVDDPAISLVYVESGALSLQLDAAISDARPDGSSEDEEADTTSVLSQGDYFVLPPLVAGEIRNEGQEPMAIVIAAITPGAIPVTALATPTA